MDTQLPDASDAAHPELTPRPELTPHQHDGAQPVGQFIPGREEGYNTREQMDVEPERSTNTNTDMLNGVAESTKEEAMGEQINGEGAEDTEMAGTA